jgi:hypothetical protein
MMQMGKVGFIDVLRAAHQKQATLGAASSRQPLKPDAPADIIAVKGDPALNIKISNIPNGFFQ